MCNVHVWAYARRTPGVRLNSVFDLPAYAERTPKLVSFNGIGDLLDPQRMTMTKFKEPTSIGLIHTLLTSLCTVQNSGKLSL